MFELHSRFQDAKQMEYLTAILTDTLDAHNWVWELLDLLEASQSDISMALSRRAWMAAFDLGRALTQVDTLHRSPLFSPLSSSCPFVDLYLFFVSSTVAFDIWLHTLAQTGEPS